MKTKSFTLIELLVVIVIIGILAGVIILSVSSNISKAQDLRISSTILSISKALKADSLDSFPIETTACNLKNSCTTLKSRIDLPNITEDIYYKTSSSGKFFVIYGNKPSNTSLGFEITSTDENVKEVPSFDNLVAYYPLAAGTANGTAISDMSPNSNNGTNYGASSTTGADGNIGTAMSFDGVDDYIDCGKDYSLSMGTNDHTVSIWAKFDNALAIENETLMITGAGSSTDAGYWIMRYSGLNRIRLFFTDGSAERISAYLTPSDSLVENTWYNIVVVFDRDSVAKCYVNGVILAGSTYLDISAQNGDVSNYRNLRIGAVSSSSGKMNGSIDDVRIYNRALTQEEITLLYNK